MAGLSTSRRSTALDTGDHEPLLPAESPEWVHNHDGPLEWLRARWMHLCGYLYDTSKHEWTDGEGPRPEAVKKATPGSMNRQGSPVPEALQMPNFVSAGQVWCPQRNPPLISSVLFFHANALLKLGSRKHLEQEDLWDVAPQHEASGFYKRYEKAMQRTARPNKFPHGSVGWALCSAFGRLWLIGNILELVAGALDFAQPFLLRELLKGIGSTEPNSRLMCLFWVFLIFLSEILEEIFYILSTNCNTEASMGMTAGLQQFVYAKSLRLTMAAKAKFKYGKLIDLQQSDVYTVVGILNHVESLWSSPLRVVASLLALQSIVGLIPTLGGAAAVIAVGPFAALLGWRLQNIEEKLKPKTDTRIQLVSEALSGMKALKLYVLEGFFKRRVQDARTDERRSIYHREYLWIAEDMLYNSIPVFIAMAVFGMYSATPGNYLTADVAFPTISLLYMLHGPMMSLPQAVTSLVSARVSLRRVQKLADADEATGSQDAKRCSGGSAAIEIIDGVYSWTKESRESPTLSDINLHVPKGSLCIVAGPVGSGKSSLLAAIMSELHHISGTASQEGTLGFTAQDPWIQNATIRENILMGSSYQERWYKQVLKACALEDDLETMMHGDATEIGGQKHRVALARACYAGADVQLLDDPLSAVDAHVQRTLMQEVVNGAMSKATRVLVTHQLQFLPDADLIVKMEDGKIIATGTYQELVERGVDLQMLSSGVDKRQAGSQSQDGSANENGSESGDSESRSSSSDENTDEKGEGGPAQGGSPQEERQRGKVKKGLYVAYFRAWGPAFIVPVLSILLYFAEEIVDAIEAAWLSKWSSDVAVWQKHPDGIFPTKLYLIVYFTINMTSLLVSVISRLVLMFATLNASQVMHDRLLDKVFSLPTSFFDTQPSGRLVSRFTKDVSKTDFDLPSVASNLIDCVVGVIVTAVVLCLVTKGTVLVAVLALTPLYMFFQNRYTLASRELNRLSSVTSSPIVTHFSETITGLMTLRAFRKQDDFLNKNLQLLNASTRAWWPDYVCQFWRGTRMQIMGALVELVAGVFVSLYCTDAGFAGLALVYSGYMRSLMQRATAVGSDAELGMNSVERMTEYLGYDSEAPAILPDNRPEAGWPSVGALEVREVEVRYRPELPLVLQGVSFEIAGGAKVGICGRTGCGKSTLLLALYRIVELSGGSIVLDGIDIAAIGLHDLRSNISFVAQDPVLFSGTIRSNLDALNCYSDALIIDALEQVGLQDWIKGLENGLQTEISDGGKSLSVGQRQLLSLARALLQRSRMLLMDEATSNVDTATDKVIQASIRSVFADCTVLTVAHRLHTVMDSDQLLVLDCGSLVENGTPQELVNVGGGKFRMLVDEAGTKS